jgi:predicted Zn-dependent protease with MMP-like domain
MKLAIIGLMLYSTFANAANIEIKGSQHFKSTVNDALKILPSEYLSSVNKTITISEVALKSDALLTKEDLCQLAEGFKFGTTLKTNINISARLVELAKKKNNKLYNCGHHSFPAMLTAVIIHELTHVKDNHEKISADPDFQRIVGVKKVTRNTKKKLMNQNSSVSPDAYEFENLEESLAVNVEYLALDPEFECRKPATAKFLSKRLGIPLEGTCQKNHKILAQSAFLEDNYQLPVSINPSRIYQIHYLFAGQGQALMSRFGHAMFRLVVCAPFRKVAGPECLNDVSHHLALSYRAYMSDMNISYSKGMFGKYPSQLFIMRFLEVQQEYTKFELRDLFSVPLKLTETQKADFLDLTLERFWTYQGKYFFLGNNCGTEAVKHLATALNQDESELLSSITPLKIYKDITNHKNELSDANLTDLDKAALLEKGYMIESLFKELNESYQLLRAYLPSFAEKDFKKFLKKTTAADRLRDYESFMSSSDSMSLKAKKQAVMKLIYLERYLSNKFLMEVPAKAIQKMNKDSGLKDQVMKIGDSLKLLNIQPWQVVTSRYGTPTSDEFEVKFPQFIEGRKAMIKNSIDSQMTNLETILGRPIFSKELAEIDDLKKIKKLTIELIIQVNQL